MNLIHHLAVIATVIYQVSAIALDVGDQSKYLFSLILTACIV